MNRTHTTALAGLALLSGLNAQAWDLKLSENHVIQFHGFASQGFIQSSDHNYLGESEDGSFEFNEVGLNATYSPFARTRIAVQGFAFDIGNVGEFVPFLDYASLDYTFNDHVGVRVGRVRRPGGIYNHIQDVDLARTYILLPQGLYDARYRDFSASIDGGTIYGNIPLSKAGSLSYEGFGGVMTVSDDGGIARQLENSFGRSGLPFTSVESGVMGGAQLWWNTPANGLRFGLLGGTIVDLVGIGGPLRNEIDVLFGRVSAEYLWNSWTFQAEYQNIKSVSDSFFSGFPVGENTSRSDAWFIGASYRFNRWLEVGTYYSEHYGDTSDRNGDTLTGPGETKSDAYQRDLALSFRFDPTDWWIFKLEGHYIRGTSLLYDDAGNPAASRDKDGWFLFAAKTTFSF